MKLEAVREKKLEVKTAEEKLKNLRSMAETIPTAILDGLPHGRGTSSRVEKFSARVIDAERELEQLRLEVGRLESELACEIFERVADEALRAALLCYYVGCYSTRESARRLHYSLRQFFRKLDKARKEFNRAQRA